jgi:hypothetical protein
MSYCRWSNDDYQCDVYVYGSVGDFIAIHVAGNRVTPDTPPPAGIGDWWARGKAGIADYMAREKAVEAWLATAERKPIGLPHDGESFEEPDEEAAAVKLEYLRELGYNVPQYAIDALREDAKAVE